MKATLVILAAGLGSRYGGNKQMDGLGPHGELLMEYSIYDALRAGFSKVVFIIKPDMQELMDRMVGYLADRKLESGQPVEVIYVCQDFGSVPAFYQIPPERTKPFGTVHALLCAKNVVHEPFCVINADDYYGVDAFKMIYRELSRLPERGKGTMVGYELKNTASLHGPVSRGLCRVHKNRLNAIRETKHIQLYSDGSLRDLDRNIALSPETPVSMNFWGFMPSIFGRLELYFQRFLEMLPEGDITSECILSSMVGAELEQNYMVVSVLQSTENWFGMTHREDRTVVAEELRKLHAEKVYPETLRG